MGLNLDHVPRGAAEHGGRVRQTHPDYSNFTLHIWMAEKWHLPSYVPCSLNIEALIQAFFLWSGPPTCAEFCTPGVPEGVLGDLSGAAAFAEQGGGRQTLHCP